MEDLQPAAARMKGERSGRMMEGQWKQCEAMTPLVHETRIIDRE